MTIEPCADADPLAAIHAQSISDPWSAADLATLLGTPGVFTLADGANGFVMVRLAADEAEILTLAVAPSMRRRGLGRALMSAAITAAVAAGARRMFLEVADDNAAARALYVGLDFVEIGRRSGYYPRGVGRADAVVMRRDLNTVAGQPYAATPRPERPRGPN